MKRSSLLKQGFLLATVLLVSACQTHHGRQVADASNDNRYPLASELRDIVYTESDWPQALQADLYLPRRNGPIPVVLAIHGGGWANRDRSDMVDISRELVSHGYAVLNLNYRLAPRYTYPAQLDDLHQALKWLVRNAAKYRFDLERINAWGYSSGAHLAALLGSFDRSEAAAAVRELPRLRAVVAGGIPADLRKYDDSPIVSRFLGGSPQQVPQRYVEASPITHVSEDDPPTFLYHGTLDLLVTPDQSEDYYAALRAGGIDAELYLQSWRGHATMFLFGGEAETRAIDFLQRVNQPA